MGRLAEAEETSGRADHLEADLSTLGQFTLHQEAARNLEIWPNMIKEVREQGGGVGVLRDLDLFG